MPGQTASYTVDVSPLGGFNQAVSLSCSPSHLFSLFQRDYAQWFHSDFSYGHGDTTGSSAVLAPLSGFPNIRGPLLLGMMLFGLPGLLVLRSSTPGGSKRRRRLVSLLGICVVLLGLSPLGCGGSGGNGNVGGTPAATYSFSLTGSFASGSTTLTHNAKLTLVVQ